MFVARFFPAQAVTVFHLPDTEVQFADLLEHQLLFVWDELADPALLFELIGRYVPFAPALLPDHERRIERDGGEYVYRLAEELGATTPGVVLLGLDEQDLDALDDFQRAPIHRLRQTGRVRVGNLERVAAFYTPAGSYLGEDD